jgi:hypothetical protein
MEDTMLAPCPASPNGGAVANDIDKSDFEVYKRSNGGLMASSDIVDVVCSLEL